MRNKFFSYLLVFSLIMGTLISIFPSTGVAKVKPTEPSNLEEVTEFMDAVKSSGGATFDLTKHVKQEKKIYNDDGKYLGTIGIEPTDVKPTSSDVISPLMNQDLPTGNSNWKIYWYGGGVNFWYYITAYNSSSNSSSIVSYWGADNTVLPPLSVTSESLSRISSYEVRYTLKLSSLWGGSITNYLYAFAYGGWLQTGTN